MRHFKFFVLAAVVNVLAFGAAQAENGRDVMDRVYKQANVFDQTKATVRLVIVDKKKRERERFFELKSKNSPSFKRSLVKFFEPPNVKGTGLASETDRRSNKKNQWVFFPSLKSIKQLSTSEQNESFMGSDFSYNDVAGRVLDEDTHKIVNQNDKFYVVESIPKSSEDAYSKYYTTVDKKTNIARRVVFHDRKGDKLKTLNNRKVVKVKGELMVALSVMENHKTSGSSSMERSRIEVDVKFSDNDVGLPALKAN